MKYPLKRLAIKLSLATGAFCAALHVATFVTMIPLGWVILPFALLFSSALLGHTTSSEQRLKRPRGNLRLLSHGLLAYAFMTFIYVYTTTDGASSVSIVEGQYVSMYKGRILKAITVYDYQMFPNLWTRVLSAWMAAMAVMAVLWIKERESNSGTSSN